MSLFFWKKNKIIDIFASDLANQLFGAIQPDAAGEYFKPPSPDSKAKKLRKKTDNAMENIVKQVNQFKVINSLGIYGKARLHMKFTERLEDLGYDSNLAKRINEQIMIKTP